MLLKKIVLLSLGLFAIGLFIDLTRAPQGLPLAEAVPADAPDDMVSWWTGDNTADDLLGNNDGTLEGTAAFGIGKVSQAFSFDGGGQVQAPENGTLDIAEDLTIDAWIRFTSAAGVYAIVSKSDSAIDDRGYDLFILDSNLNLHVSNAAQDGGCFIEAATSLPINTWVHVAATVASGDGGGEGLCTLYINGVLDLQTVYTGQEIRVNNQNLHIGAREGGDDHRFVGQIDEVEIFDRALSAAEIDAIHDADSDGKQRPCAPIPQENDLVSWWRAENTAIDFINGNDGLLRQGATYASGKVGRAFSLDGLPPGSGGDYIEVPDSASLDVPSNTFTVDAWVYWEGVETTPDGFDAIYTKSDGNDQYGLFINRSDNSLLSHVQLGVAVDPYVSPANTVTTNTWFHVAQTYDGANARTYVNGQEVASFAGSDTLTPNNGMFSIGSRNGIQHMFDGLIDEVELWDVALTEAEIESIYEAGNGGKCYDPEVACVPVPSEADLISWWRAENTAIDFVGPNDGTAVGGVTYPSGKVGRAFSFDGVDDRIAMASDPSLELSGTEMTIDAWINPDTLVHGAMIAGRSRTSVHPYLMQLIDGDGTLDGNSQIRLYLWTSVTGPVEVQSGFTPPTDEWTHIAMVYTGSELKLYVNGSEFFSQAQTGNIMPDTGLTPFGIGNRSTDTVSQHFDGLIDEVEIWDVALDPDDIKALFLADSEGKCYEPPEVCVPVPASADLISWWPGENNARDIKGMNHGTLNGEMGFGAGKVNDAFVFDGVDDLVTAPAGVSSSLNLIGDEVTIDGWINPAQNVNDKGLFGKIEQNGGDYGIYYEDSVRPFIRTSDGTFGPTSGFVPPEDEWTHLALTYDSTLASDRAKLYVNGSVFFTFNPTGPLLGTDTPLVIGGIAGRHFNGLIDEVQVWDVMLDADQIKAIYLADAEGKCRGALELMKDVSPDGPGAFDLMIDGSTLDFGDEATDNGATGQQPAAPGTHTLSEAAGASTDLADYTATIECRDEDGAGDIVPTAGSPHEWTVDVAAGDDIVCIITNTLIPAPAEGKLQVKKALGPVTDPGKFNLRIDGVTLTPVGGVGNAGETTEQTVAAGNHTVSETAVAPTVLSNYGTSIICRDGDGAGAIVAQGGGTSLVVNVAEGADVVCVITNGRLPAECLGKPIDNVILGDDNANTLTGTNGRDLILGFGGADTITGSNGNDCLSGGDGNDNIQGGNNKDIVLGGANDDTLSGGTDDDYIDGGPGNDTLNGDTSNDRLLGGDGDDRLNGGANNDVLIGGNGNDRANGGASRDACQAEQESACETNP
jgi:Ca2+-binding RTX toxin-like protein